MPKENSGGCCTRRSFKATWGGAPPGLISLYLVSVGVGIIRDGEVDLVYNPVPGPLAHAAGYAKKLPGCILGEKTFLSGVRTPEPTNGVIIATATATGVKIDNG